MNFLSICKKKFTFDSIFLNIITKSMKTSFLFLKSNEILSNKIKKSLKKKKNKLKKMKNNNKIIINNNKNQIKFKRKIYSNKTLNWDNTFSF
jgi:hypothetical protein